MIWTKLMIWSGSISTATSDKAIQPRVVQPGLDMDVFDKTVVCIKMQ